LEDQSQKETTQPQPEERPAEAAEQATPPAAAETGVEPQSTAEPQAVEPTPASEAATAQPTAEPQKPKPQEAPTAKPTGPRLGDLRPGSVVEGKVTRIERYGAFVDLGLVERRDGLVHISELAPYRVRRVEDVVKVGDNVRARVVSVDMGRGRIALSLNDVDAQHYDAEAAARKEEPMLTSMAIAFDRAYGQQREKQGESGGASNRGDRGSKARRDQEMLMEKLRTSKK